jgi:hypothetical protein
VRSEALLERIPPRSQGASVALACSHFVKGDIDQAVALAGKALDEGYPMTNMFIRPFEQQLRGSRGWEVLTRKLNLPEAL